MKNTFKSPKKGGNNPSRGIIERKKYVRRSLEKIPKEKFCSSTWKYLKT